MVPVVTDDDAVLMARFVQTRDRQVFAVLFQRYERRMINHARRFVRDPARAEELAQDIFVRVYTTKRYEPNTKFSTWLYRVATNVCLNELRRPEHQQRVDSLDAAQQDDRPLELPSPAADPEQTAHGQQLAQRLTTVMARLPPKQRAAFLMARQDHMSHEENRRRAGDFGLGGQVADSPGPRKPPARGVGRYERIGELRPGGLGMKDDLQRDLDLLALAEGGDSLSAERKADLEREVAASPELAARLKATRLVVQFVDEMPSAAPSPNFAARLERRLDEVDESRQTSWWRRLGRAFVSSSGGSSRFGPSAYAWGAGALFRRRSRDRIDSQRYPNHG